MRMVHMIFFITLGTFMMGCAHDFNRAQVVGPTFPRDVWIELETRAFESVRYDSLKEQLTLKFNTGTVHSYQHFPEAEFNRFITAGGKWGFYKSNIRGVYPVIAQYPAKKPGSFSVVHQSLWSEPVRLFHSEMSSARPAE